MDVRANSQDTDPELVKDDCLVRATARSGVGKFTGWNQYYSLSLILYSRNATGFLFQANQQDKE